MSFETTPEDKPENTPEDKPEDAPEGAVTFPQFDFLNWGNLEDSTAKKIEKKKVNIFQCSIHQLLTRLEVWNETTRVKASIADVKPCDYKAESAALVQALA